MQEDILRYEDFVRQVIAAIEAARVAYMIGGAVAAWAWGEPRATLDLDLVVNIPLEAIGRLSEELGKRNMFVPGRNYPEQHPGNSSRSSDHCHPHVQRVRSGSVSAARR